MDWQRDDSAVSGTYIFAIAGSLLVVTVGVLVSSAYDLGRDDQAVVHEDHSGEAHSLLSTFLGAEWQWSDTPGQSQSPVHLVDGALAAEDLLRFQGVSTSPVDKNALVDYDEAHDALNVDDAAGFHIRISPLDISSLAPDLSDQEVLLIADWDAVDPIAVTPGTDEAMMAEARTAIDASMAAGTADERSALSGIGTGFDDLTHFTGAHDILSVQIAPSVTVPIISQLGDASLLQGDVLFDDDAAHLQSALPSKIDDYDVVIIGAGVDPAALDDASIDTQLRNHVSQGGLLIALGGTADAAWFETIKSAMKATANPGISTPDYSHPILNWPAPVEWGRLQRGPAWSDADLNDAYFHHILPDGDGVGLAISQAGSLGDGMIVAGSLGFGNETDVGQQLLANIISYYARSHWFLDYGEPLPDDVPVASSIRLVHAVDADDQQIPLRVTLHYWRYG